jgi:hypothetical protein
MTTWLTTIVTKCGMTQWVRLSPKKIPKVRSRILVSSEEATSVSKPRSQIRSALRRDALLQLPAVARLASFALVQMALLLSAPPLRAIPSDQPVDASTLPDAPEPLSRTSCPAPQSDPGHEYTMAGNCSIVNPAPVLCAACRLNWYQRFANGPQQRPLTPGDKGWLAARNFLDPFSLVAVTGEAGISVAADSHSPNGPGMPGFGRSVGVGVTEDMTGEFFGTFLIPSLTHQDPHYYRMEHATTRRRIGQAFVQVLWTRGDNGKGMPNYANLVGFAADDLTANLYVPGRDTAPGATAARYTIDLASAPIGNLVSEFLPDVASHIHVQVVIIQRIINQVVKSESGGNL